MPWLQPAGNPRSVALRITSTRSGPGRPGPIPGSRASRPSSRYPPAAAHRAAGSIAGRPRDRLECHRAGRGRRSRSRPLVAGWRGVGEPGFARHELRGRLAEEPAIVGEPATVPELTGGAQGLERARAASRSNGSSSRADSSAAIGDQGTPPARRPAPASRSPAIRGRSWRTARPKRPANPSTGRSAAFPARTGRIAASPAAPCRSDRHRSRRPDHWHRRRPRPRRDRAPRGRSGGTRAAMTPVIALQPSPRSLPGESRDRLQARMPDTGRPASPFRPAGIELDMGPKSERRGISCPPGTSDRDP